MLRTIASETEEEKQKRLLKDIETERKRKVKEEKLANKTKEDANKAYKIRVYPVQEQEKTLNKWYGVRRFIYNKCTELHRANPDLKMQDLRNRVVNSSNYVTENTWMNDYEFDLRDEAMRDYWKNVKTNEAKGGNFKIQFQSRKTESAKGTSLSVLCKKWNKANNFYCSIFNPGKLKSSEPLPDKLGYTCRLQKTPTKKYYLCVPEPLQVKSENQAPETKMIFFDPGQKAVLTGYDPSGTVVTIGRNDIGRISRLLHYKNKLKRKISKCANAKKVKRLRRAMLRTYEVVKNLVTELHRKVAKWLCENYTHVFLPKLNFHKMTGLNKKSKEKMASLSHCSLFDTIQNKTREHPWCHLLEVNEAFTTKTCCRCGSQNPNVGNSDTYKCIDQNCRLVIGRDTNAAVNILLRYFTKRAVLRFSQDSVEA